MDQISTQESGSASQPILPRTWKYYAEKVVLYLGTLMIGTAIVSFAFQDQWPTAYAIIQGVTLFFLIAMYAAIAFGGSDNARALGERSPFLFYLLLMKVGWTWPAWIRSAILLLVFLWAVRCCVEFDYKREQIYREKLQQKMRSQTQSSSEKQARSPEE